MIRLMERPPLYPAAVTPFDAKGRIDRAGLAKLLAWFDGAGCRGVVLAGTNGEGPSLSAVEKRDLVVAAKTLAGDMELVLGISTPSTDEAVWLCKQAHNAGGSAVLLMPPGYFREAADAGILEWFRFVLDRTPVPVIVYNFPKRTGVTLTPEMLHSLSDHVRMAGVKDSSGESANLAPYREAVRDRPLYVGDETLLLDALAAGWTGSISGAANVVPVWLAQVLLAEGELREARFSVLCPVLEQIRKSPQPATHKALLHAWGVLPMPDLRLPLLPSPSETVASLESLISERLGTRGGM